MSSLNTNFSCDVILNGNDAAPAGPFATIAAAVTYLTTNFALASGNHGTINIGPGVFTQSISVSVADKTRFIDYVGAGINDTVLQGTTSAFISINVATAENRFSNMTISYTGTSTLGNTAIDVIGAADVWFTNCKITSTQRCINNLANGTVLNCTLVSAATNAETLIAAVGAVSSPGRLYNCIISAGNLASGGGAIGGTNGFVEYCDVSLNTNVATHGIVSGSSGLTVSHSNFVIGGYLYNSGSNFSHLYVNSTCVSTVALQLLSSGIVDHCYFTTTGNQSLISSGGSSGTITNSSFIQNNSQNVYSAAGSGTKIFNTVMQSNSNSAYCITANAVGNTLDIANVISTATIDPGFALADNGFLGLGINIAKGYSGRRWWGINCNGLLANGLGCTTSTTGTLSSGNDSSGPALIATSAAVTNSTAQIQNSTLDTVRRGYVPTFYVKFKLNQTTNVTFWCGLFNNALPGNAATLANDGMALRYVAGTDTNWQYVTNLGGTQTTTNSTIAANTGVITLKISVDNLNSRILFQLNSSAPVSQTTNLPSMTSDLGFAIQVAAQTNASEALTLYDAWCEYGN